MSDNFKFEGRKLSKLLNNVNKLNNLITSVDICVVKFLQMQSNQSCFPFSNYLPRGAELKRLYKKVDHYCAFTEVKHPELNQYSDG